MKASPYDRIAELYDPWSRSVIEDVSFYVDEALAVVERALDGDGMDARRLHRGHLLALHVGRAPVRGASRRCGLPVPRQPNAGCRGASRSPD